jgi:hypothetical protein
MYTQVTMLARFVKSSDAQTHIKNRDLTTAFSACSWFFRLSREAYTLTGYPTQMLGHEEEETFEEKWKHVCHGKA